MSPKMQYLRAGLLAIFVASCTTFTARQVDQNTSARGLFVPQEVPLLVIHNGQVSIVMACNPSRGQAIEFGAFLAKHDVEVAFQDTCGLKSLKSNQDSTAIPLKLLEVAGSLAEHVLPAGKGLSGSSRESNSLQVYGIHFENGEAVRLVPLLHEGPREGRPANLPIRLEYTRMPVSDTPIEDVNANKAN